MSSLVAAEKEWSQISRSIKKLKDQIGELEQTETLRGLTSAFEKLNTQLTIVRHFETRSASKTWTRATDGDEVDAFLLKFKAVKAELEDESHRLDTAIIAKGPAVTIQPKVEDSGFQSRCRLPALELATFDGEMQGYESWWLAFDTHVHSDNNIPNVSKYQYLLKSVKGPAKAIVSCFRADGNGYIAAIGALKDHYAGKEIQIDNVIDRFYDLNPPKYEVKSLFQYQIALTSIFNEMEALKVILPTDPQQHAYKRWIVRRLPAPLLRAVYVKIGMSFELKELVKSFGSIVKEMESSDSQYLDSPQRYRGKGKGDDAATLSSSHGGRSGGEPPRRDTPSRGKGDYQGGSKNTK